MNIQARSNRVTPWPSNHTYIDSTSVKIYFVTSLFSRRAHTVLTLLIFIAFMVYVAVFEDPDAHDNDYNFKRFVHHTAILSDFESVFHQPSTSL